MRRFFTATLAAIVLVSGFSMQARAEAPQTVTLYVWIGFWEVARTRDMVRDFEQLHDGSDGKPAIKVVIGESAEIDNDGGSQRLLCSIGGGDPPDMAIFGRHSLAEWASRDAFVPLQEFLERDLRERPEDPFTVRREQFYPPCWSEATWDGKLYAIPTDTDNRALYYNKDLLDKHAAELIAAGCVDPDDPARVGPPRTWEQLRKAAKILTERDASGKLVRVGFIPNFGNSWLYLYGWLNGGEYLSPDGKTCTLNSPEIVDALAYMTELYDDMGGAQAVYAFQSSLQVGDLDPFFTGKIAMKIDGSWALQGVAQYKRDLNFGVTAAPAPEGKPRFGWCGGWSYVMPKGAKHPNETWELMKHLVSKRAYGIQVRTMRQQAQGQGMPFIPTIHARADLMQWAMQTQFLSDPGIEPKFKVAMQNFLDIMPESRYRPVTPAGQLLWSEQVRAMEQGIFKRYDSDDVRHNAQLALDRSAAIVQRELDRVYKPVPYPLLRWTPIIASYVALLILVALGVYFFSWRRAQGRGYFRHEFGVGYAFALPWFIGFVFFGGGPILFSLFMSFCSYDILNPPQWVGMKNYADMFADPLFYKSFYNTLYMGLSVPLGMAVGLGIAMLLNHEVKGMAVYRTFFYLPAIMPAVAASILWLWVFNPEQGVLNLFLRTVGVTGPAWLQSEFWAKPALILMTLWGAGAGMIVWLAGLKGIPAHLYEAAEIDGAGPFRQFWNITLPMLSPYIFFNLIMGLIGTFQIFTQAYVMTKGGPLDATLFYAFALFNQAFRYMHMGYASAMAWVLFAIVFLLTLIQMRLASRWVHYESEN